MSGRKNKQLYEVKFGFNLADGTRFDAGTAKKPKLVRESDFPAEDWQEIMIAGAVVARARQKKKQVEVQP